jgi:signal transduction histidine kinase
MLSVTHELKSPIAAMKLNLQTIEKHKLDEEKRSWLISRCIKEANRLNDLCNNILFTSRLEGGQYKPSGELFSFTTLAEDIVDEYGHRYPQRFSEDIATGCQVFGDRMMLEIAVNNLIENALKYSPADSMISISLHKTGKDAILRVTDMGVGIKDEEKKNVFTKFYRIGNEESRKTQGTGLGLYLTNKIIVQHKGRITIRDNKPTGAIFEICLPLAVAK